MKINDREEGESDADGGWREGERRLRGWEVFSLSVPVVHISLSFSLSSFFLFYSCFLFYNWEKWSHVSWVRLYVRLHASSALPPLRGSTVAEDKQENPRSSRHACLWRCLSAPLLCACVHARACVCSAGRVCVIHYIEPGSAPITVRIHMPLSSEHTCRHLSQRERAVCVYVCVCLLAQQCVCKSDRSCIKEIGVCSERLQHHDWCTVRITVILPLCIRVLDLVCGSMWAMWSSVKPVFLHFCSLASSQPSCE